MGWLLAALAALLLSALPAFAGTANANASGSGNWSQTSLWSTSPAGFYPNNGVNGESWSASMTAENLRFYSVTLDVPVSLTSLDIRNGSFVVDNPLTLGSLYMDLITYFNQDNKPTISGSGQIDVSGPMTFNSGTLGGSGVVNANGGLTIVTQGGVGLGYPQASINGRTLNNVGVANFSGTNHFNLGNNGVINNLATGTWTANPNVSFTFNGGTGSAFNNLGVFHKNGGTTLRMTAPFNNSGTANINGGFYQLFNNDTHSGTCNVASGAELQLFTGTHTFTNTAVLNVPAGATFVAHAEPHTNGGLTTFAAPVNIAGDTVVVGGTLNFNATTTLNTLNMNHQIVSSVYVGGYLGGSGTTTVTGAMTWYNGYIQGTGLAQTFNANGGVAIVPQAGIDDTSRLGISNRTMNIGGTNTNSSLYLRTGQSFNLAGRLNNLAGSTLTLDLETDFQGFIRGSGGVFDNQGTLKKIGTKYLIFEPLLTNSGTLILEGGVIGIVTGTFNQTAGETRLAGGNLSTTTENFQGGSLTGFGVISGAVTVTGGTVAPTGAMIASNTVSLTSASTVDFDLGGTTPGTGYDTLRIDGGGLARNGTLRVRFANGFQNTITPANTFTIITTAAATTGQFSNVIGGRVDCADGNGSFAVNAAGTNAVVLSAYQPAVDTTPPTIAAPAGGFTPLSIATGAGGTVPLPDYTGQAVTGDNIGVTSVTQVPAAGSARSVGTTNVTVTAHDAAGNTASVAFNVTVTDGTPPAFTTTPADRNLVAGAGGTLALPDFTGEIVATDNVAVTSMTQSPAPGTVLGLGAHVVTFTVKDAATNQAQSTATMTIINALPGAQDDVAYLASPSGSVTVGVLTNDSDANNDPLTVTAVTQGAHGSVAIVGPGLVTYTAGAGFTNSDTFTYTVDDGNGGTDSATVTVRYIFDQIVGKYAGLIGDGTAHATEGFLKSSVTAGGAQSSAFYWQGFKYALKGTVPANGVRDVFIPRIGGGTLALHLVYDPDLHVVAGTLTDGAVVAAVNGAKQAYTGKLASIAPQTGKFTAYLRHGATGPQVDGYGVASVKKNGAGKLIGTLPNGKKFTGNGWVQADGSLMVYGNFVLGANRGSIFGTLGFPTVNVFKGSLHWTKPALLTGAYPGAILADVEVDGARYVASTPGVRLLALGNTAPNGNLAFGLGGGVAAPFAQDFLLDSLNVVTMTGANPRQVALTVAAASGLFTGSFLHPVTGLVVKFGGVVRQDLVTGHGFFLGATDAGPIDLTPLP